MSRGNRKATGRGVERKEPRKKREPKQAQRSAATGSVPAGASILPPQSEPQPVADTVQQYGGQPPAIVAPEVDTATETETRTALPPGPEVADAPAEEPMPPSNLLVVAEAATEMLTPAPRAAAESAMEPTPPESPPAATESAMETAPLPAEGSGTAPEPASPAAQSSVSAAAVPEESGLLPQTSPAIAPPADSADENAAAAESVLSPPVGAASESAPPSRQGGNSKRATKSAARLQAGGTLAADHIYIKRPADTELLNALRNHEYCYVFATRQIGKSSLRLQVQTQLRQLGYRCASISLDKIGTEITTEQFCCSFLDEICAELEIEQDISTVWQQHPEHYTAMQRFIDFFANQLAAEVVQRHSSIVIFIDEIDTLLSTRINRGDFFAALRALYNLRADHSALRRITFCLLGVASPGELISDATRTPFNIGHSIQLADFSRKELDGFRKSLARMKPNPEVLLDEIFHWVGGHPYMTQKICVALRERRGGRQPLDVSRVVQELFLAEGRYREQNLQYAEKRIDSNPDPIALLTLYQRLLSDEAVAAKVGDLAQIELVLCGLARETMLPDGKRVLSRRNVVYSRVFNSDWVQEKTTQRTFYQHYLRWHEQGRNPQFLLRDTELRKFKEWAKEHAHDITTQERELLDASIGYESDVQIGTAQYVGAVAQLQYETEKRRHAEQDHQRARTINKGLMGIGLLLLCFLGVFYHQNRIATQLEAEKETARIATEKNEQERRARELAGVVNEGGANGAQALVETMNDILKGSRDRLEFIGSNPSSWDALVNVAQESSQKGYLATRDHEFIYDVAILPQDDAGASGDAALSKVFVIAAMAQGRMQGWSLYPGTKLIWETSKPTGHDMWNIIAFDEGRRLLTRSSEEVILWNLPSPKSEPQPALTVKGEMRAISAADISRDGSLLAMLEQSTVRIISTSTGATSCQFTVERPTADGVLPRAHDSLDAISLSADQKTVSLILNRQQWEVWSIEDRRPHRLMAPLKAEPQTNYVRLNRYEAPEPRVGSPELGRWLSLDDHGLIRTYSAYSEIEKRRFQDFSGKIEFGRSSPNGRMFATIHNDGKAHIWDADRARLLNSYSVYDSRLRSLAFSPDARYIAAVGVAGHQGGGTDPGRAFVQAWKLDLLKYRLTSPSPPLQHSFFSPDGKHFILLKGNRNHQYVEEWNWDKQTEEKPLTILRDADTDIENIDVSESLRYFLFNTSDKKLYFHDTSKSPGKFQRLSGLYIIHAKFTQSPICNSELCTVVTFNTGAVQIFDLGNESPMPLADLPVRGAVKSIPLSKNRLAIIHVRGEVSICELANAPTCQKLKLPKEYEPQEYQGTKMQIAYSSQGRMLAVASNVDESGRHAIELVDLTSFAALGRLQMKSSGAISALAFSPDGKQLVAAYQKGNAVVWSVETKELLLRLSSHKNMVSSVSYSPDGKYIITSSFDGTTKIHLAHRNDYFRKGCELFREYVKEAHIGTRKESISIEEACAQLNP